MDQNESNAHFNVFCYFGQVVADLNQYSQYMNPFSIAFETDLLSYYLYSSYMGQNPRPLEKQLISDHTKCWIADSLAVHLFSIFYFRFFFIPQSISFAPRKGIEIIIFWNSQNLSNSVLMASIIMIAKTNRHGTRSILFNDCFINLRK